MKRTTIMLPSDLKRRAARHARNLGISLAGLIRELLAGQLAPSGRRTDNDPLFSDTAVYAGKAPKDLSEKHDDYLYGKR